MRKLLSLAALICAAGLMGCCHDTCDTCRDICSGCGPHFAGHGGPDGCCPHGGPVGPGGPIVIQPAPAPAPAPAPTPK
jgi:hypothetical protein